MPLLTHRIMTVSAANRGSLIVADLIVLSVTLRKTLGTLRTASRLHMRVPLVATLVKDGEYRSLSGAFSPLTYVLTYIIGSLFFL